MSLRQHEVGGSVEITRGCAALVALILCKTFVGMTAPLSFIYTLVLPSPLLSCAHPSHQIATVRCDCGGGVVRHRCGGQVKRCNARKV